MADKKPFYISGYGIGGYVVRCKFGEYRVASFVSEMEAKDYIEYRNYMLNKYDTTDVEVYVNDRK